ncbi:hypothetical protein H6G76_07235 [Nostoc sp. FACHB-152]|uniref:hypothetical protein n=1 Tax=unclassified Nostoc TaxID=2593658 RepID=UPI0016842CFD|nr:MULTISPECIES: hypothetical protein [unclassified Nostoc]MBD2446960.1 hypothetical protein [Nostoc sp. FACHB-152]MBD2467703.1 hypothetical protein [Nostoc sp. FACHB-145]
MMNNFSVYRPLSTFKFPENPFPTSINLSPVNFPDTSSPWYAMPVIVTPSASQFRF